MSNRKYEIREAGNGFLSKLGTGIIAAGSVTAAVVAVSPQGAALESLIYNPQAMLANNVASGTSGSASAGESSQSTLNSSSGGVPPTLEDYLVLGDIYRGSQLSNPQGTAPLELGSILSSSQSGGSVGNVTNSTQYASGGTAAGTGDQGNVTGSTPTADAGNGGNTGTGENGNVTSPTPGGGEDSYGEDNSGEDSEDSHGEDSHDEDGGRED